MDIILTTENKQIIDDFIRYRLNHDEVDYLNDSTYLGMMFYGSRLTNSILPTSDLDLCVICASGSNIYNKKVVEIDGIEVEYFEKDINFIMQGIDNDYNNKSFFPKTAYYRSYPVFDKIGCITEIKDYIEKKYTNPIPNVLIKDAMNDVYNIWFGINNLYELMRQNNNDFDTRYYLLLDKIQALYHRLEGITKLEISKTIRVYSDPSFRYIYSIDEEISSEYINSFMAALNAKDLCRNDRIKAIKNLFSFVSRSYYLNDNICYDIKKHKPYYQSSPIIKNDPIEATYINLPDNVFGAITFLINSLNDPDNLIGCLVFIKDLNSKSINIDVQFLYNDPNRSLKRGYSCVDNYKINFCELPICDENGEYNFYQVDREDFLIANNTYYSIIDFTNKDQTYYEQIDASNSKLNDYVQLLFAKNFPKFSADKIDEELIVLKNRVQRLESYINIEEPNFFDMYRSIIIYKMINLYRGIIGNAYIDPSDDFSVLLSNLNQIEKSREEVINGIIELFDLLRNKSLNSDEYKLKRSTK